MRCPVAEALVCGPRETHGSAGMASTWQVGRQNRTKQLGSVGREFRIWNDPQKRAVRKAL